jgi:pyridoxamine 5'-phosphate oxidase
MKNLHHIRTEYRNAPLMESDLLENPLTFFEQWFDHVLKCAITEPNVFTLSTYNEEAKRVSSRILLLKEIKQEGFIFFTNYESQKGIDLAKHPQASMNFYWNDLFRQIRVEGVVKKISAQDSDEYFYSRPRASQIGAVVSAQSRVLSSRADLEIAFQQRVEDVVNPLKRPSHWGGYLLVPDYFEFWQGRESRLHDRFRCEKSSDAQWKWSRLSP